MKILLISYFIAPLQEIGSIRWTKISKHIEKKYDVQVDVLTMEKDFDLSFNGYFDEKKDPLLTPDMRYFHKYTSLRYGFIAHICKQAYHKLRIIYNGRQKIHGLKDGYDEDYLHHKKTIIYTLSKNLKLYIKTIINKILVKDSILQCLKYIDNKINNYDVIISSFSPMWTHMVAESLKQKNPDLIWLADFRDPYSNAILVDAKEFEKRKKFTQHHFTCADAALKVLDEMKLYLPASVPEYTISNGFDPNEAVVPTKPKRFNFVYTGTIYEGKQDFTPLFEILRTLSDEKKINLSDVVIDYAGSCDTQVLNMASKIGLSNLIRNHGRIDRAEVLRLQTSGAILLLAGCNTKLITPCWSGKAYEYMMAKKPIVYLMSGDVPFSLPARNISKLGGYCYEEARKEETMQGLKQYILEQYKSWKETGDVFLRRDEDYVDQYSYDKIAEQVWNLIQNLEAQKGASKC